MANKTITSDIQEDPQSDECRENIPPDVSGEACTSKLKVPAENETLHSSVQLCEENRSALGTGVFSTPAPTGDKNGVKATYGFQSALTPILKSLNIDNECSNSHLLKCADSPHLSVTLSPISFSKVDCQKSNGESGSMFCEMDAPMCLIEDECLPEITDLNLTYLQLTTNDSVLPENAPAASKLDDEIKEVQTSTGEDNNDLRELLPPVNTTESTDLNDKMNCLSKNKSTPAATGILETEITLLDASHNVELSPVEQITSMDTTQDFSLVDHLKGNRTSSELCGQIVSEPDDSVAVLNKEPSNSSVRSVKCATETTIGTSLDVTMASILEKSNSSSDTSGEKMMEDKVGILPANITHNTSSSSERSAHGAHLPTSDVDFNTSSTRVTSEVGSDPAENSNLRKTEWEETQTSCDIKPTSEVSQQSQTSTASGNRTFQLVQSSYMSAASDCNSTASVSCLENKTFEISLVNSSKAESDAREQAKSKVQNVTFDRNSLQKSCDGSTSGEAVAADLGLQNNTVDCKALSQKNCIVTLSEISSSDNDHNISEKPSSPKGSNLTTSPEDEDHSTELPKPETAAADEKVEKHNDTSEAISALESAPAVGECECKDLPQPGLPVSDGHLNVLNNQSMVMVNNKANTFDLDETLDLEANFLVTSTPMTSSKMFNSDNKREADAILAVQKKLYQDDPNKPTNKMASDIPSNIICDRKTFFAKPPPRALCPPSKAASQMLKNKPGSTIPGRLDKVATGLPIKRPKTQAGGVKTTGVEETHRTSGISSSYNLRPLAAASKLPTSGLQRPQQSGIPFGIQRAAPGLRPLSARSNRFASSSTNKPAEPTATSPVTKSSQGKKHPLTKADALPVSKRKKTDTIAPSSNTEATTSSCDATNRVKTLKQPTASLKSAPVLTRSNGAAGPAGCAETGTSCDVSSRVRALKPPGASLRAPQAKPPGHDCSQCVVLQEELKQKSDEIQRLKRELQKYQKQEDC
ncbi:uncharacterized protein LOC108246599 [Kryptolebias marmoratus]|uniref:uncharacterized protein LOC108246599 n=1 Tax=Kryptolebias marmoratus TaxID=37003 RepID=UPI0007F8ACD6|nr:uncharacterized protein LOC108246599 [Kryptolebias marmoratus]